MPYGLPNETPEMTAKMERCVTNLTGQGKEKGSAVAICKAAMMKGEAMPGESKENNLVIQTSINLSESKIDESKMTVEAVVLAPCVSLNGRYYSPAIVESAVKQLIGLKSFADHYDRSVGNTIARIVEAKFENGKAVASFKFSKAKDIAESVFTRIKEGIITDVSIAASGQTKRVKINGESVDEVLDIKLYSVDFVSEGGVPEAKVMRVFESNNLPTIEEVKIKMTIEELRAAHPELIAEMEKPMLELKIENESLKKEVADFKTKIQEKEMAELKSRLLGELQENEAIKALIAPKITGNTEAEMKASIEMALLDIRKIRESLAKIDGLPPVEIKKEGKKKTFESSRQILDDKDLSVVEKSELIHKLWWG